VSLSVLYIIDKSLTAEEVAELLDVLPLTQSAVISLYNKTIEANFILEDITGCRLLPASIPAPEI
jgi:hypothetical protein